jgi:hypothetical protein
MRSVISLVFIIIMVVVNLAPCLALDRQVSFGPYRDSACVTQTLCPPMVFPPIKNPFAAPCRIPGLQMQAVPCQFQTACPSEELPYTGMKYGDNPYHLFK